MFFFCLLILKFGPVTQLYHRETEALPQRIISANRTAAAPFHRIMVLIMTLHNGPDILAPLCAHIMPYSNPSCFSFYLLLHIAAPGRLLKLFYFPPDKLWHLSQVISCNCHEQQVQTPLVRSQWKVHNYFRRNSYNDFIINLVVSRSPCVFLQRFQFCHKSFNVWH